MRRLFTLFFLLYLVVGIVNVNAENIFEEDFSKFTAGTPDGGASSSDITTTLDTYTTLSGWTGSKIYQAGGTAKMGTSNALGWIQTPEINLSANGGNFNLTFKAMAWNGDATDLKVYLDDAIVYTASNMGNTTAYTFSNYSVDLSGGTATSKIKFEGNIASKGRFFLDDVVISQNGSGEPTLSNDATLKSLTVGGLNILKPNTYDYTYKLAEGTTEVPVIVAETNHENATINNEGEILPTISGIVDGTANRAVFPVVAEDGVTAQTYTITFSIEETVEGRIFFETCGESAPTGETHPTPAEYAGWDNPAPVTFDGNADVRATATLNSHVWFAANSEKNLIISGINTANAANLKLSFDIACNKANANANAIFIKVKDLATSEEISITVPSIEIPEQNKYVQVTNLEGIPVAENLEITFYATKESNPSGYGYRLDNIQITEGTVVELSSNNNLKSLSVSKGTLNPVFDPAVLVYSVVLPENDTEAPSITCEVEDSKATVALDEPEFVPGTATITVTAENGDVKTYKISYSNALPAGVWMETFETETTKNSYPAGDYQGTAALWEVFGLVRNDDDNDKKHGLAALRLRDPNTDNPEVHHYIAMKEDKANGAGQISLYHGMYSNHTGGAYTLEVSNNGGETWDAFTAEVEEVPSELTQIAFDANVSGNIRIKITKEGSGRSSINIDDILITDYRPDGFHTVNSPVYLYTQYNNLFVKNADVNAKITIFDLTGKQIESANATEFTLPAKGVYIVKVNSEIFKIINK
ncbi:MAG: T9SS type A sorting domain-containing protein [Dysgonamonadaceae bacterium]|jgi:hypothetical protein|nr:T9SS type A sorting domain-containing protein [Dysgonamonadaceae bacterium]